MAEPTLVSYYLDGWRTGWMEQDNGFQAVIRPIGPRGTARRTVTVPSDDVKPVQKMDECSK